MKIEMCDNSSITIGILGGLLILACLGIAGCHECETTQREAMKAGLQQVNDTAVSTHWAKP